MSWISFPQTADYFALAGRTATVSVTEGKVTVTAVSHPADWAFYVLPPPPVAFTDVAALELVGGATVPIPELNQINNNVDVQTLGLLIRGYDRTSGAIQFEADSQNSELSASNDNPLYRGLRAILRDLRLGPWLGTWAAGTYGSGARVSYIRDAVTYGFVSLKDGNTQEPLPPNWSVATVYFVNNEVFFLGATWRSTGNPNVGNTPFVGSQFWTPFYSEWWTIRQFAVELSYGAAKQTHVFTWTLVNDWNEEGPPADTVSIDADYGQAISLHAWVNHADNQYQDYRKGPTGFYRARFYGMVADSQGSGELRLIQETDEFAATEQAFGHFVTTKPSDWQNALETTEDDLPPPDPIAIAPGPNGMLGIVTPTFFAASATSRGWSWPGDYRIPLPTRAVSLVATQGGWVVTTQGKPQYIAGAAPDQLTRIEIPTDQAGISQAATCSLGENGVAYASNDGIVLVQGLGATLATGTLFTRKEWRDRYATLLSKMRLIYHDQRLVCLFPGTAQGEPTNYQGFIIRFEDGIPTYTRLGVNGSGLAIDTLNDQLLIGSGLNFSVFEGGDQLPLTWQSKEFLSPRPENMGAVMVEYTGGPFTIDIHADGATRSTKTLPYAAGRVEYRYRLPAGYKSQRWSIYILEADASVQTWDNAATYPAGVAVAFGGFWWASQQAGNQGHVPTSASTTWWARTNNAAVHRILLATTMAELARL